MRPETKPDDAWWREGVLYQVYPRSFQDSDGDGIGDLRGITERLDHLNGRDDSLGIDGIWISPFFPSPMADFGYDVADYCDVDPRFGTLADFDELLREAHARGIRVVVDLVPNHTSDQHAWFRESRSSRTNPKRDWYVWADPKPDRSPPNNWQTAFTRLRTTAWTLDEATGQYYLHSYLPEQPDLNWWNPAVRDAFDEVMRFWLDRGVDGFRVDVAHRMARDPELRDNPAYDVPFGELLRAWTDANAPRDQDWPGVHDIIRRFRRTIDGYPGRLLVGEVYLLDPARLLRYYGNGSDEFHLAFNFAFLRAPWAAASFRDEVATFERLLPPGGWPDYTLSNHDNPRAVSRYAPHGDVERGRRRARMAAVMILTLRGTPFIYQGEEIGMADGEVPADRVVDVSGRDGSRTPMQWDAGKRNGGFTTGDPWLPVGAETAVVNVESQRGDSRSTLALHRRLIRLRRASPALRRGAYRPLDRTPDDVFAWWREADGERWLIACNFGGSAARLVIEDQAGGRRGTVGGQVLLRLSSDPDRGAGVAVGAVLELGPEEGLVLEVEPAR